MKNRGIFIASTIAAVLWVAGLSRASMVTYEVTGTLGDVVDYSGLGYVPNAILNSPGTFVELVSFNNSAAPVSLTASSSIYRGVGLDLSAIITIDGIYTYSIITPDSGDEIDISGTDFELFKRGPTVYTSFAPNPPFSHVDFEGTTTSVDLSDAQLGIGSPFTANGLSDQQTSGAGYYYIGLTQSSIQQVPEPAGLFVAVAGLMMLTVCRKTMRHAHPPLAASRVQ